MAEMVQVRSVKHYKQRRCPMQRDYKQLFRFEEENVEWLANTFLGPTTASRGGALHSVHKMKITLRY